MKFTQVNYSQHSFSNLDLANEVISDIEFEECTFSNCSFVNCTFENCKFLNCKFEECILSAILPVNSRFSQVTFVKSKVIGFDWTKANDLNSFTSHIQDLTFQKCQINYSNFRFLKLPRLTIVDCEAKEVDFTQSDLKEGIFTNTDFERSIFASTNLTKADFTDATNYQIDARFNTIKKAIFSLPEALCLLNSLDIIVK